MQRSNPDWGREGDRGREIEGGREGLMGEGREVQNIQGIDGMSELLIYPASFVKASVKCDLVRLQLPDQSDVANLCNLATASQTLGSHYLGRFIE